MQEINKIFEEIEKLHQSLDLKDELTEDLYHYTTFENSIEIFKTRRLFMGDYKYVQQEFKYTLKCLKQLVPEKSFSYNVVHQGTKLSKFWEALEWYLDHKIRGYRMSFCLGRDKAYMWEIFSRNNGVALRFSKEYFKLSTIPILSLNNGQVDPILARTRISLRRWKTKRRQPNKISSSY